MSVRGCFTNVALILAVALFETLQHALGALDETRARIAHVLAEAVELDAPGAASESEDQPPAGQVVEHADLLGDAHRVVPRQHHHHRSELHARRAAGHVRQELQRIRTHRVIGEVVLHRPHRVEAERFGQTREAHVLFVHFAIGRVSARILENRRHTHVHLRYSSL